MFESYRAHHLFFKDLAELLISIQGSIQGRLPRMTFW
jgi:hypothetical protein